jgi:hypothetical protein
MWAVVMVKIGGHRVMRKFSIVRWTLRLPSDSTRFGHWDSDMDGRVYPLIIPF